MSRRPPRSTRTDTLVPYTTLFRSNWEQQLLAGSTKTWKDVLQTGFEFKGDQPASAYSFDVSALGTVAQAIATQSKAQASDVEVQLYQSVALKDGKQANNAYLQERSKKRRVGKECVSTCRSRWSPYN